MLSEIDLLGLVHMMIRRLFHNINKVLTTGLATVCFFLIQFLWWRFEPGYSVPISYLMVAIICMWIVWLITYAICSTTKKTTTFELPRVRNVNRGADKITILIDKHELYAQDVCVSIYYCDNDSYEVFLGVGIVENITMNGFPQIIFMRPVASDEAVAIIASLSNDKKTARSLKIKPNIQGKHVQGGF